MSLLTPPDLSKLVRERENHAGRVKDAIVRRSIEFRRAAERDGEEFICTSTDALQKFEVVGIGSLGNDVIILQGINSDGTYLESYQHYTQVSVTMMAIKKQLDAPRPTRPKATDTFLTSDDGDFTELR